jgi:hypothetical protein
VPRLSIGSYTEVTFGRYRENATYCGERLWMDPMDVYDGITCAVGKKAIYGWYRRVTRYSLIVEQIRSLILTGHASLNLREWIVTSKARDALRTLFTTGDPPCWDERLEITWTLLRDADTATGLAAWCTGPLSTLTPTYARGPDSTDFARTAGTVTTTFAQSCAM